MHPLVETCPPEHATALLAGYAARLAKQQRRAVLHVHHASDLGKCPRLRWIGYANIPRSEPFSGAAAFRMRLGELAEQAVWEGADIAGWKPRDRQRLIQCEPKGWPAGVRLECHLDMSATLASGEVGIDHKLMGAGSYAHALREGPSDFIRAQMHGYMAATGRSSWVVLGSCFDLPRGLTAQQCTMWRVLWDGELWSRITEDVLTVEQGVASSYPPPVCTRPTQTWQCRAEYCSHFRLCQAGDEAVLKAMAAVGGPNAKRHVDRAAADRAQAAAASTKGKNRYKDTIAEMRAEIARLKEATAGGGTQTPRDLPGDHAAASADTGPTGPVAEGSEPRGSGPAVEPEDGAVRDSRSPAAPSTGAEVHDG